MDIIEALQDLQTVKSVAAGMTRRRNDVYVLMTEIYRIGRKWLNRGVSRALRDAILEHEKVRVDRRTTRKVFRFLIELTCSLDTKLKSRYANAMEYARLRDCPATELTEFLKKDGIEKSAKKYIAHRKNHA